MRVAIVGASTDRHKFGNKAVRSYASKGHEVVPINPNQPEIEGLPAFPSISVVPPPLDRVLMYVPPQVGITLLPAIKESGAREIFLNPGTESEALLAKAKELGLNTIQACAIIDIGDSPSRWP